MGEAGLKARTELELPEVQSGGVLLPLPAAVGVVVLQPLVVVLERALAGDDLDRHHERVELGVTGHHGADALAALIAHGSAHDRESQVDFVGAVDPVRIQHVLLDEALDDAGLETVGAERAVLVLVEAELLGAVGDAQGVDPRQSLRRGRALRNCVVLAFDPENRPAPWPPVLGDDVGYGWASSSSQLEPQVGLRRQFHDLAARPEKKSVWLYSLLRRMLSP